MQETVDAAHTRCREQELDLHRARETLTALQDSRAAEAEERHEQRAEETSRQRDEARRAQERHARELEELHTERRTLQETEDAAQTQDRQHEAGLNSARETLTALQDSRARERKKRRDQAAQETAHRRDEA